MSGASNRSLLGCSVPGRVFGHVAPCLLSTRRYCDYTNPDLGGVVRAQRQLCSRFESPFENVHRRREKKIEKSARPSLRLPGTFVV